MTAALVQTSTQLAGQLLLKPAGEEAHPFVRDSWLRSQWDADMSTKMPRGDFTRGQGARIDRLLERSAVIAAYHPAEPDEVLGYIVFEAALGPVVHWVYVKQHVRRLGVAAALLDRARRLFAGRMQHTHKADARGKKLASKFESTFNPYLVEET